jgi:hypothetical protein
MNKRMRTSILGFGLVIASGIALPAHAAIIPELTQHLTEMLDSTESAVNSCPTEETGSAAKDHEWFYRRFWLRFRPRVSFAVPGFAKLEIVPEIEMLWQRDLPTGWEVYKP